MAKAPKKDAEPIPHPELRPDGWQRFEGAVDAAMKLKTKIGQKAKRTAPSSKSAHDVKGNKNADGQRGSSDHDEPPVKRLVDLQARNDECRARNLPDSFEVPLTPNQRRFGFFFTFGLERLEKWSRERRAASV